MLDCARSRGSSISNWELLIIERPSELVGDGSLALRRVREKGSVDYNEFEGMLLIILIAKISY